MAQPSMQRCRDKYTPFRDAKMNTAACRGAGLEMETGLHMSVFCGIGTVSVGSREPVDVWFLNTRRRAKFPRPGFDGAHDSSVFLVVLPMVKPQPCSHAWITAGNSTDILSNFISIIRWVWPLPSNNDHQDYSFFSRESQPKPLFATGILGRGLFTQIICMLFEILSLLSCFR